MHFLADKVSSKGAEQQDIVTKKFCTNVESNPMNV